jgi:hypothetical protein
MYISIPCEHAYVLEYECVRVEYRFFCLCAVFRKDFLCNTAYPLPVFVP